MKLHSPFHSRGTLLAVSAVALAAGLIAVRAKADEWNKKTILTINSPIQVRETVLQPGRYVFKLDKDMSYRHVVQIFNADESRIIDTEIAFAKERLDSTSRSEFTFWETPPGTVRALRAWYYPGDLIGQEFPYPKHLQEIAMNTSTATVTSTPAPQPAPAPAAEEPAPTAEQNVQPEPPAEVAQNTPPPAEAAPEPAPAAAPPVEMPKTASPYPLIGFSGLAMLGLAFALKLRRSS